MTFEALADLGPIVTGEGDFSQTSRTLLASLLEAVGAREGALLSFTDKPAVLRSLAAQGFLAFPDPALIPLLPRNVHALNTAKLPQIIGPGGTTIDNFLSSNGNVAPELFKCIAPLRIGSKLVGVIALGRRHGEALYGPDEVDALTLLSHYVALAVHNWALAQSLEHRITENLRLMASLHTFYDNALEAFAAAIDIKHVNVRGHSLRVGRYSAGIAEAMGLEPAQVAGMRAAGLLHDIGKVAVDKRLFAKPAALDPEEFREMADHTTVGHRIVSGVEFPWPIVPEVVRSHHERADGTGYPDKLHLPEIAMPARITAVADTFDAMVTERPYRAGMSVGEALSELVRIAPQKFDPQAVQALLIQVRRDAAGSNRTSFLDESVVCNIAPTDVDHLASSLNHKATNGRVYLT
ncbi:MAG TPA: HD domain-containing phosphohydrolase [Terriglobales bacterium]|nr:HD domain-containing phosphohydrolase [Terriglobales bacterium]